jgi:hypothetical protein
MRSLLAEGGLHVSDELSVALNEGQDFFPVTTDMILLLLDGLRHSSLVHPGEHLFQAAPVLFEQNFLHIIN